MHFQSTVIPNNKIKKLHIFNDLNIYNNLSESNFEFFCSYKNSPKFITVNIEFPLNQSNIPIIKYIIKKYNLNISENIQHLINEKMWKQESIEFLRKEINQIDLLLEEDYSI